MAPLTRHDAGLVHGQGLSATAQSPRAGRSADQAGYWTPELLLALAFTVVHIGYSSTLAALLGPNVFRACIAMLPVLIVTAIGLSILRGRLLPAAISTGLLALIAWQLIVFSQLASFPINWNVYFTCAPIAAFAVYAGIGRELDSFLRLLFWLSLGYCVAYLLASEVIGPTSGGSPMDSNASIKVLTGDARGARLVLAGGYTSYCIFYCVAQLRAARNKGWWAAALAIASLALITSMSRVLILLVCAVSLLVLLNWLGRGIRLLILAGFITMITYNLAGVFFPSFNPYAVFLSDSSGSARAFAYRIIGPLLTQHFLSGIGLSSEALYFNAFIGQSYVFWEDLGAMGLWSSYGLVGLILCLAMCCILILPMPLGYRSDPDHIALSAAAMMSAVGFVYSPDVWGGSSVAFTSLVVAIHTRSAAPRQDRNNA